MRSEKIDVSLVVTAKNDAPALRELLRSIEQQARLPGEVVLVVAESAGTTLRAARSWQPKGIKIQVLSKPGVNRAAGRNLGVERATGGIIAFTDAGCRPQVDWLEKLTAPFTDPKVKLVSGYTVGEWQNAFEEAQVPFVLVPVEKIPDNPLPATRNLAIWRSVFQQFGGFRPDLDYAEDFEFSRRLQKEGILAKFVPEAVVYWRPRRTSAAFFIMIAKLTAGDVQAGILRPGLWTMWGRYLMFAIMVWAFGWAGVLIYLGYLISKSQTFHLSRRAKLWAVPLQVVCDLAVLAGSVLGLASRSFPRENTSNAT